MIRGIHHLAINTANLELMIDLYRRACGFEQVGTCFSWRNSEFVDSVGSHAPHAAAGFRRYCRLGPSRKPRGCHQGRLGHCARRSELPVPVAEASTSPTHPHALTRRLIGVSVHPQFAPTACINRVNDTVAGREEEGASYLQRLRHAISRRQIQRPGKAQTGDIVRIDLNQGAEVLLSIGPAIYPSQSRPSD